MAHTVKKQRSGASKKVTAQKPRTSMHSHVYERMKHALMSGAYKPGQKITIRAVASALGTSPMPVREALRRLTAEGALETRPNRTTKVPELTRDRLAEITAIRVALETLAARHAAVGISDEEIEYLEKLQLEMAAARDRRDYRTYLKKNEEFHLAYYRAARMQNLLRAIESMWLQSGPYLTMLLPKMRGIHFHSLAISAARRRDPEDAARAIEQDIVTAAQYLHSMIGALGAASRPRREP